MHVLFFGIEKIFFVCYTGCSLILMKGVCVMVLSDITDVNAFLAAVNGCKGPVYLKTPDGDLFNLKSSFSQYIAIGQLISDSGNKLEIFAEDMEDWSRIHALIRELNQRHEG